MYFPIIILHLKNKKKSNVHQKLAKKKCPQGLKSLEQL